MSVQRKYLELFLEEGAEIVAKLGGEILALERQPGNRDSFRSALRLAHTLKGGAKMVGLENVSLAAHRLESALKSAAGGGETLQESECTLFLTLLDRIHRVLDLVGCGRDAEALDLDLLPTGAAERAAPHENEHTREDSPLDTLHLDSVQAPSIECRLGADRLRVGAEKLDSLQNLVDDLTLQKFHILNRLGNLQRMVRRLDSTLWDADDSPFPVRERVAVRSMIRELSNGQFAELFEEAHRLDHMVTEVQRQVLDLRMVPLAEALDGYQRMVRSLAKELGKEVNFTIEGKFTELDKRILDMVQGPLRHLVRNAVDHGVEAPAERLAAGKARTAEITLRAYHKGSEVVIEVEDDGRGLSPEEIRAAALRQGVCEEQEFAGMGNAEVYYLLCKPGFSTREQVTEVSGRGVGLDVVKVEVERVNGSLVISSQTGRSSRFSMHLPLSISTLPALIVEVSGVSYAVPTAFVDRCFRVDASALAMRNSRWQHENQDSTVVSLARALSVAGASPRDDVYIVALRFRGRQMLIQVDRLTEEREIILKPLGSHLKGVPFVSGMSFAPSGEPIPVLNVSDVHGRWQALESTAFFESVPPHQPWPS